MSYTEAIEQLDRGDYDSAPQAGRDLIWQVREGVKKRYFKPTDSHTLILYRWAVADMFYTEQETRTAHMNVTTVMWGLFILVSMAVWLSTV
ncbi:Uncharacterised protein [Budvicia aquatica]|uniref:Uncharacterized protein n=1 Tax=Budvicia aquatica TaxID=82979 RepID=A0A484ZJ19_9GAMM|nr:Uncharacterised protein [Budvicia aquatica]